MKNYKLILLAAVAALSFSACSSGDHSANNVPDSVRNPNTFDAPSNTDTFAVSQTMGEASNVENAGNGGTTVAKDTTKMKVRNGTIPAAAATPAAAPAADTAKAAAPKK